MYAIVCMNICVTILYKYIDISGLAFMLDAFFERDEKSQVSYLQEMRVKEELLLL